MKNSTKSPEQGIAEESQNPKKANPRKPKAPFLKVNEKYEPLLNNQVGEKDVALRRNVIEECINRVKGVSHSGYQKDLRDAMTKLLFNFSFLMDCQKLDFDCEEIFYAAQNVVMYNKLGTVIKDGLTIVFKGKYDLLKEEAVYSEDELSSAKYDSPASKATEEQKEELSQFIKGAITLLSSIKN
ncbi:hypothetical protein D0T53_05445 [Dysgonomonas sp. 216]|uniref:hypothetical protein n=1 Tax=Dysgonomonas sp. 216 TaxID=2302934 RepID=UPI0013D0C604|nr:hypothetical protein [Dysgonomonas sp. 216]NDW18361.1 hypothetical protein [Dysgonomonas sp. 216]